MRISGCIGCREFPCEDVKADCYVIPNLNIKSENVSIVMISESAPANPGDYYYAKGDSLF